MTEYRSARTGILTKVAFVGIFVIGALVGAAFLDDTFRAIGSETNTILLLEGKDGCYVFGKSTGMKGKKDNDVKWKVKNSCQADEYLSVGNFRRVAAVDSPEEPTEAPNCKSKDVAEAGRYPFRGESFEDRSLKIERDDTESLRLKLLKDSEIPGDYLFYHYDICLGQEGDRKQSDPRIMIEK